MILHANFEGTKPNKVLTPWLVRLENGLFEGYGVSGSNIVPGHESNKGLPSGDGHASGTNKANAEMFDAVSAIIGKPVNVRTIPYRALGVTSWVDKCLEHALARGVKVIGMSTQYSMADLDADGQADVIQRWGAMLGEADALFVGWSGKGRIAKEQIISKHFVKVGPAKNEGNGSYGTDFRYGETTPSYAIACVSGALAALWSIMGEGATAKDVLRVAGWIERPLDPEEYEGDYIVPVLDIEASVKRAVEGVAQVDPIEELRNQIKADVDRLADLVIKS